VVAELHRGTATLKPARRLHLSSSMFALRSAARIAARLPSLALAVLVLGAGVPATAADEAREVEGRALFARGEYQASLDLFSRLYAEKADPVFLRNIGRCHQKLRKPGPAIDAFRDYLRLASVDADERAEVEGFIREMEELRQSERPPTVRAPAIELAIATPTPGPEPSRPITRRWWFWTGVGALVLGAAASAIVLGHRGGGGRPACPPGVQCL
jgi:hypothetical protein